jgi:ketosteroid isomerase-like protein
MTLADDRAEIADAIHTYAWGVDRKQWASWDNAFTPEAAMEFPGHGGKVEGRDQIRSHLRKLIDPLSASQHVISNLRIIFSGPDSAAATAYYRGQHVLETEDPPTCEVGGIYHLTLRRTEAGWRITYLNPELLWMTGNTAVLNLATLADNTDQHTRRPQ